MPIATAPNEVLFIVTSLEVFLFVFLCYFGGRRWLYTAIAINLIAVSLFGAELISVFGKVTNISNIFYAAVFFVGQLIVEHYGKTEAKKTIWLGLAYTVLLLAIGRMVGRFTPIPESAAISHAVNNIFFTFAPRVALASLIAYPISQRVNIELYSYIGRVNQKQLWLRSLIANFGGQLIDSCIFFSIAFLGTIPYSTFSETLITGFQVKFIVGLVSIPLLYASYKMKRNKEILEQEAEAILLSIGNGIVMTDRAGKIVLVNQAFTDMLGWKSQEVVGKLMTDVIEREDEHGKKIPYRERILTKVLSGGKVFSNITNHTYFVRKDGSRFPVLIAVTPVHIDGKIMGAVESFRDVTREEEIETARTDFLSLASHQLRTPLSGIRWILETFRNGSLGQLTPEQKEYINNLYSINIKLIQLVSDMLSVLRIQSGVLKIKKEKFTATDLFGELNTLMEAATEKKGIKLKMPLHQEKPVVFYTDFQLVKNIVEAFISNAINYSNLNGTITVDCTQTGTAVIVSVADQGIGIPKNEQRRIFERFYRASNAKRVHTGGTGLGLYISYMLAQKIGGQVSFTSKEMQGSTFYLTIPKSAMM